MDMTSLGAHHYVHKCMRTKRIVTSACTSAQSDHSSQDILCAVKYLSILSCNFFVMQFTCAGFLCGSVEADVNNIDTGRLILSFVGRNNGILTVG